MHEHVHIKVFNQWHTGRWERRDDTSQAKAVICFPEQSPTDLLPSHMPPCLTHTHAHTHTHTHGRARTPRVSSGKQHYFSKRKAIQNIWSPIGLLVPSNLVEYICKHALRDDCVKEQKFKPRYRSLRVGSCWMLGLVGAIFLQQLFDFLLSVLFSFSLLL